MDVRYLIYLLPFFFIGISLSLKPLTGLYKCKNCTLIYIVIFFLIQAPFLALYYNTYFTKYSKEDWRGISNIIEKTSLEGDYIIVIRNNIRLPLDIYYNNRSDGTYEFGVQNESDIEPILRSLRDKQGFFIVTEYINSSDPDGSTTQWLHNNTQRIGSTKGIELHLLNASK